MKCEHCGGTGILETSEEVCPKCKGTGKTIITLGEVGEEHLTELIEGGGICLECGGTGKIRVEHICPHCKGSGEVSQCIRCGCEVPMGVDVCENCASVVYVASLDAACDMDDVSVGMLVEGKVQSVANIGAFVQLSQTLRGLIRCPNLDDCPEIGESVVVEIMSISANGNIELKPVPISDYEIEEVEKAMAQTPISKLDSAIASLVRIEGEVVGVKQTTGPTLFTLSDGTGTISCVAFEGSGVRAYASIRMGSAVRVFGEVSRRNGVLQVEIRSMKHLLGEDALKIRQTIEESLNTKCTPSEVKPIVESDYLNALEPAMKEVARELLRCAYTSRPILIRHHADADGITAATCIGQALLPIVQEVSGMEQAHHFLKCSPSKAPFYEMSDVVRDLNYALSDAERFEKKLPLILLVDNGSTVEDVPALRICHAYGVDVMVVDHHHPDKEVDALLKVHVNPAHVGADYNITTGMLCLEIARRINPGVTEKISHLAAVSAMGDRARGKEAEGYIEHAKQKYPEGILKDMALSLDYLAYWLRFSEGGQMSLDVLNLSGQPVRHRALLEELSERAEELIQEQLESCMPHVKSTYLPNNVVLNVVDVEKFTHRFTFPPPGKTTGEIHDRMVASHQSEAVVTIGYGPDFAVVRSTGVEMNFPELVRELKDQLPSSGVSGGGHLVVGSIKFLEGMKKEVLGVLAEKISKLGTIKEDNRVR